MIIPAILENKLTALNTEVSLFERISPLLHIDIGDGYFVELKSDFTIEDVSELSTETKFQIHLMCINPEDYIQIRYHTIESIIFHAEVVENYLKTAKKFKSLGYQVGVCVNLETPAPEYFEHIDFLQFMSIVPGAQQNKFDTSVIQKIFTFSKKFPEIPIQVDGGVNNINILELRNAGVLNFAVGSFILKSDDPIQTYKDLCGI